MAAIRKPLQGTINIIRFNWHFYLLALMTVILLLAAAEYFPLIALFGYAAAILVLLLILSSLAVSCFVYDLSGLYSLHWLDHLSPNKNDMIVNINAGFDETSEILKARLPHRRFYLFDFYDPAKHTEVSIKRARKMYPPPDGTQMIRTSSIPLEDNSADKVFVIFAAHEIRDTREKILFFKELKRVLKPGGKILVTEHLRDLPNYLAYHIGSFHFYPLQSWKNLFGEAGLEISGRFKTTPFITTFMLIKNGTES